MEQEVITFKQAFEDLNKRGNNSLFNFDGEKIIPLNRIRLILMDSLNVSSDFDFSFSSAKSLLEVTKTKKSLVLKLKVNSSNICLRVWFLSIMILA
jgi:hypothetical protein